MLSNTKCGYITGAFEAVEGKDIVWTVSRIDENGDVKKIECVISTRDLSNKNVFEIGDEAAFMIWRDKNGKITDDE